MRRITTLAAIALATLVTQPPVGGAQERSVPVTRDAEIEALVSDMARPLLKAAGLFAGDIEIVLVNDGAFNAFVLDRRIFVNVGVFLHAEGPDEIAAILAHEIGHIAGGHQERLREQLSASKTQAVIAMLAGVGATIAGAASNNATLAQAGQGIAAGGSEAAMRGFLAYKRGEEAAADRSAVRYLNMTGQSPAGLQRTFRRFQKQRQFATSIPNPYLLTHPLPRDRLAAIDALVASSPNRDKPAAPELQRRFDMARAKVAAYLGGRGTADRLTAGRDAGARDYGLAIGDFLKGDARAAVSKIDALVAERPKDPFVHEMRGEILMRTGRPGDAVGSYRRALELKGESGIMRAQIGAALLATNDPKRAADAIAELRRATIADPTYVQGHRDLARALQRIGDEAGAHLATAEGLMAQGQSKQAKVFARRAQDGMTRGTPSWQRAQDIIDAG